MLNVDRLRGRQEETEQSGGASFFKPKDGRNTIRLFAFQHKVTKEDVAAGYFDKKQLGKTVTELDRPVTRAFGFTKSKRPLILRDAKEVKMIRDAAGEDRNRMPRIAYMMNVVDTSNPDKGVLEFACPKTVYHDIAGVLLDEDYRDNPDGLLGVAGRDFIIEYNSKADGSKKYQTRLRAEGKSEELPDSVEEGVKDYYDPEVFASLGETADEAEPKEDEEEEEAPKAKKPKDEEEEESEEDEDLDSLEDEEEEVKPAKKTALPKKR